MGRHPGRRANWKDQTLSMKIRWKFFLILFVFSLTPLLVVTFISQRGTRHLGQTISDETQRNLSEIANKVLLLTAENSSKIIVHSKKTLEFGLRVLVSEAEKVLSEDRQSPETIYFASDFDNPLTAPPDLFPHRRYWRKGEDGHLVHAPVSFKYPVFYLTPSVNRDMVEDQIVQLSRLGPAFRRLTDRFGSMIYWAYASTEDGLQVAYPGHGGYPPDFDPRQRPWYRNASNTMQWSLPTVDATSGLVIYTVSHQFHHPDGSVAGVVGIDIEIAELLQEEELSDLWSQDMRTFVAVYGEHPQTGKPGLLVFAQKEYQQQSVSWNRKIEMQWLSSKDTEKFNRMLGLMRQNKSGYTDMPYGGVDSIWAYAPMGEQSYFVVVVPKTVVLELPEKTSREVIEYTRRQLLITAIAAGFVVILLGISALIGSRTITRSLLKITSAAKRLSGGDFSARIDMQTGDERDQLIEVFNGMGPKLEDHLRLNESMHLAMEVQRNLLPLGDPQIPGLDIAGISVSCDETGGDYYDYLDIKKAGEGNVAVIVGDVSGHGMPAALLMASARAFLRQRTSLPGGIAQIVADVNHQLSIDVRDSGSFMTLFYLTIDTKNLHISWVRAGHDPAIIFDPASDTFDDLPGRGIALGVEDDWEFEESARDNISGGQIILIGTDGIWEAKNEEGEMFGKEPIMEMMRNHADNTARHILESIMQKLDHFRGDLKLEDDVTLVVIKFDQTG
jgi:sigma-B regulation protein RsbU (phosphoserine phosphatase)